MDTIHKQLLILATRQIIRQHVAAQQLTVHVQHGEFALWYRTPPQRDNDELIIERAIYIIGTGRDVPNKARKYITTVIVGDYVWHFFEGEIV